jgi:hypothetical protein
MTPTAWLERPAFTAEDFARLLHLAMGNTKNLKREPTADECPNWCALKALDDAGQSPDDADPLIEIAFWEFAAWISIQTFGARTAHRFANLCRAYANDVLAGITTEAA